MAREIEQDWDVKGQDDMHQEVIRSSYLDGGDRLYLIYDEAKGVYRVAKFAQRAKSVKLDLCTR